MPYYDDRHIESASETFTAADWLETIADQQPGPGDSFSLERGESVIVVEIDWRKARSFIRFVLGWSYADQNAPFRMHRENPVPHPRYAWLTADTVTLGGMGPVGVAGVGTRVAGVFDSSLPIAKYSRVQATVRFVDRPWLFLPDSAATTPTDEALRNTYFDPVPSVEIISAEGINTTKYANGPATGALIPAPFGTLMSKCTYTLNWMWVPNEYISGSNPSVFRPTRLEACTGRVNSDTFFDFPPGTLLMQAPQYTRFRFPILSDTVDGYYGWNVKIPLQFFDPPRGVIDATYRGHQCIPYRPNLLWYGAVRGDAVSKIYSEASFISMFKHVDAP